MLTQALFSIGLVADCQYADSEPMLFEEPAHSGQMSQRRFYRLSPDKMREAVRNFDRLRVDAIINLGDLVDRRVGDIEMLMGILSDANAPLWSVAGNHDFGDQVAPPDAVFAA